MTTASVRRRIRIRRDFSLSPATIATIERIASEQNLALSHVIDLAVRLLDYARTGEK